MAKGKYICILKPDDYITAEMLQFLYQTAAENDLDIAKADFKRFRLDERWIEISTCCRAAEPNYYDRIIYPCDEPDVFLYPQSPWNEFYKRSFLKKQGIRGNLSAEASVQDIGFRFQAFLRAKKVMFIEQPLYMERRDPLNMPRIVRENPDAVSDEYKFIWELLSSRTEKHEALKAVFYAKKIADLMEDQYNAPARLKPSRLQRIREEFSEPLTQWEPVTECLKPLQRKLLQDIIKDPNAFYDRIRVTVIIPAYNVENYIRQCLDSILTPDEIHMEVIAVDDGSTDSTLNILREYEEKAPRGRVISQENRGAGTARNKGMEYASGDYLAFLDADDFFEPGMLRLMWEKAYAEDSDLVVCRSENYLQSAKEYQPLISSVNDHLLPKEQPFSGVDIPKNIFRVFVGWPWDKLIRTGFVLENGLRYQEQRTTNDLLFIFSCVVKAERISILDQRLAFHRQLDTGQSLSVSRELSWDCFYHALIAFRDQLRQWRLYERFEQDYINYCQHFSLWNINSLVGNAYKKLYDKLKNEWFDEFGVSKKPRAYFYDQDEFQNYLDLISMDSDEYLFFRIANLEQELMDLKNVKRSLVMI